MEIHFQQQPQDFSQTLEEQEQSQNEMQELSIVQQSNAAENEKQQDQEIQNFDLSNEKQIQKTKLTKREKTKEATRANNKKNLKKKTQKLLRQLEKSEYNRKNKAQQENVILDNERFIPLRTKASVKNDFLSDIGQEMKRRAQITYNKLGTFDLPIKVKAPGEDLYQFINQLKNFWIQQKIEFLQSERPKTSTIGEEAIKQRRIHLPKQVKIKSLRSKSCCCSDCAGFNQNNWLQKAQQIIKGSMNFKIEQFLNSREQQIKSNELSKEEKRKLNQSPPKQDSSNLQIMMNIQSKKMNDVYQQSIIKSSGMNKEELDYFINKNSKPIIYDDTTLNVTPPKSQMLAQIFQDYKHELKMANRTIVPNHFKDILFNDLRGSMFHNQFIMPYRLSRLQTAANLNTGTIKYKQSALSGRDLKNQKQNLHENHQQYLNFQMMPCNKQIVQRNQETRHDRSSSAEVSNLLKSKKENSDLNAYLKYQSFQNPLREFAIKQPSYSPFDNNILKNRNYNFKNLQSSAVQKHEEDLKIKVNQMIQNLKKTQKSQITSQQNEISETIGYNKYDLFTPSNLSEVEKVQHKLPGIFNQNKIQKLNVYTGRLKQYAGFVKYSSKTQLDLQNRSLSVNKIRKDQKKLNKDKLNNTFTNLNAYAPYNENKSIYKTYDKSIPESQSSYDIMLGEFQMGATRIYKASDNYKSYKGSQQNAYQDKVSKMIKQDEQIQRVIELGEKQTFHNVTK